MIERYIRILGLNEVKKLLESFEKPLKPVIRTNTILISPEELQSRLNDLGFTLEKIPWAPIAFRVIKTPKSPTIGSTHEYLKGYYYVHRDAASLIPVILLTHNYKGEVIDTCAAPGGKTTYLVQLLENKYHVIANDLVLYRLKVLISHLMRMKIGNVKVLWSDARKLPTLLKKKYQRVLVDAPCSGEGTIMLDHGRKTRTALKDLARIVKREIEILYHAIDLLEPGGILAYATCSIAPEENEYVLNKVLEIRDDIEIVNPPIKLFDWDPWLTNYLNMDFPSEFKKCIRIWPHKHGMIGFTTCLIRKV
ncbi:MAG: RsmB/NOP family class I SAM-dependent RNA methyltransferase [Staphylothermus sp.]|nr:RsmB/NOP family class I SAM-dependent RNA methyltransferase [Staphylothermus sp.]